MLPCSIIRNSCLGWVQGYAAMQPTRVWRQFMMHDVTDCGGIPFSSQQHLGIRWSAVASNHFRENQFAFLSRCLSFSKFLPGWSVGVHHPIIIKLSLGFVDSGIIIMTVPISLSCIYEVSLYFPMSLEISKWRTRRPETAVKSYWTDSLISWLTPVAGT